MRFGFLALSLTLLASCVTPEQDAARAAAICNTAGRASGTPDYEQCIARNVGYIQENRQQTGAAIGAGLRSYGQSMQANTPVYRPPMRCNSYQMGGSVNTTCY